jgi:copper resistance protein B
LAALALAGPCLAAQSMEPPPTADSLPVGDAPAPPVVRDNLADRIYGAAKMDRARAILAEEHGGMTMSKVMANLAEYTTASHGDGGYRWDAEAWIGGDRHRAVFKTEGAGLASDGVADAEAQALYSRAIGRYTDVQAGIRYELRPEGRAHAAVALESLLPYWFKVHAALFVSDRGDVSSRLEGSYDFQITQRWILQPRAELLLSADDVPDAGIGSGLATAEVGLRLRYEIRREFAPYLGVSVDRRLGRTADYAHAGGDGARETRFVLGLRGWF